MSIETWQAKYPTVIEGELCNLKLKTTLREKKESQPGSYVWSARLSTGIFGLHDCKSGNSPHAPKGANEVVIALGDWGLDALIDLGFLPCPTCHPENTPDFWNKAKEMIEIDYPELSDIHQFLDRKILPFDSRRVNWEALAPYLTALPNRLYVPENLTEDDLRMIETRFNLLNFKLPPVGYYMNTKPYFQEYKLP